ncbi:caspase family protein [Tengunoibacter tsumagoiensis]|uniref:NACHT domain-containing protein n=1 Tax=Tengunoibacter tsumagoiensis TaxID=2014871 RepID=A0A402A8A8_9CHLR|nr:caspase family protein [Tengunoibacter tsumagoiensis]GCE15328.1 hypothetical protein KTT_51870 [Tengunoibacter tsumagoiensis]
MKEQSTYTEKRYAVCIGINDYIPSSHLTSLRYAEQDAQAIDEVLGTLGFDPANRLLLLGKQATLEAMNEALTEMFLDRAQENDLVVFFYAGHGKSLYIQQDDEQEVFLCNYDFDEPRILKRRSYRMEKTLGMQRLRKTFFEGKGSRKRLFLLDCCASGGFAGSGYRAGDQETVRTYVQQMLDSKMTGRVALSSCLLEQHAAETTKYGHGYFTYHVLQALKGLAPEALRRDGCLTVNTLFEYLSQALPERQRPVLSGVQHDVFEIACYPDLVRPDETPVPPSTNQGKEDRLRTMLADHTAFIADRLQSFVGRAHEIAELQQMIQATLPMGGYVSITGQAGQGKSSMMAKLVEAYKSDLPAFHFIPFNPGPDHQVGLLRNLMARLILKYNLSETYVSTEVRAALRDYLPNLLREIASKGGQEVLFIDGLDQIEEDLNGVRDLSFLPTNPPAGIVFVLATRPNDALQPLTLLKPHHRYALPNLSRADFALILQHHNVRLDRHLADQFYEKMEENALYLDLVARELQESPDLSPQDLIQRLATNPNNLFSVAMERFKCNHIEWREVIKPVLGLLLVARQPLTLWQIRQILHLEDDRLRGGITRLGGFIRDNGQRHYTIFHLKLQEYLRQDEANSEKDYVFATDEEEGYHDKMVNWCEPLIWEDSPDPKEQARRIYARNHYIKHLFSACQYDKLFHILDEGSYGRAKEQYDITNRSYIQDLDLGKKAAINYGHMHYQEIASLPRLWKYTLLRGSLRSQVDSYPDSLFQVGLALNHENEILGWIELLTDDERRVSLLIMLVQHYHKQQKRQERERILLRAISIASDIAVPSVRVKSLMKIAKGLCGMQEWERVQELWRTAQRLAREIEVSKSRCEVLIEIAKGLSEVQEMERALDMWREALRVARRIEDPWGRASALSAIAEGLSRAQEWECALELPQEIEDPWDRASALSTIVKALSRTQEWDRALEIAREIVEPVLRAVALSAIAEELSRVGEWERALGVAREIEGPWSRASALSAIAEELSRVGEWERALELPQEIKGPGFRDSALSAIAKGLSRAQAWERALEMAREIEGPGFRDSALSAIAEGFSKAQEWERALEVSQEIEVPEFRASALSAIAEGFSKAQEWERALKLWRKAQAAVRGIDEPLLRPKALSVIAKGLNGAQEWERALEMTREIEVPEFRDSALSEITEGLSRAQEWERALEVSQEIEVPDFRASALNAIAEGLSRAQEWERALGVAREIEESESRASALSAIAVDLSGAQEWERALGVAREIEVPESRASALSVIAEVLSGVDRWDHAQEVWREALGVAREIEVPESRASALSVIAEVLSGVDRWDHAQEVWREALGVAREIEVPWSRASALSVIAEVLSGVDRWDHAQEVWREALGVAREIEVPESRASALTEIVNSLSEAQEWAYAQDVAREIREPEWRAIALSAIAKGFSGVQKWEHALKMWEEALDVARGIDILRSRVHPLKGITQGLCEVQKWEIAVDLIQRNWLLAETRSDTLMLLPLASGLIQKYPWLGTRFFEIFAEVDELLRP